MSKNRLLLGVLVSCTCSLYAGGNIAPAEETVPTEEIVVAPALNTSAFYVGLGYSYLSLSNDVSDEEFTSNAVMLQIGYKYNAYFALEGRYTMNVGDLNYDAGNLPLPNIKDYPGDFTNMGIYLKPMYPVGNFSLYGLLGYGEVEITNIPVGDVDRAEEGFQWGLGADYRFNDNVSLFVDYVQMYNADGFDYRAQNAKIVSDAWTFGLTYTF